MNIPKLDMSNFQHREIGRIISTPIGDKFYWYGGEITESHWNTLKRQHEPPPIKIPKE